MATQQAIVVQDHGNAALITDFPYPALRDDYILVKVAAVALNPVDWQQIDFFGEKGALVGNDYAGTVVEVGKAVRKEFKKGDRVSGLVRGTNAVQHQDGAFAQYIVAKGDLQFKLPDGLSFEDAATLGAGVLTVGRSLYHFLKLPLPSSPATQPTPVLIYGGGTVTGMMAIQWAKLSNLEVYTTASPRHHSVLQSLGADHVFDYHSPTCAADIFQESSGSIRHVLDTVSETSTAIICLNACAPGASYNVLNPIEPFPPTEAPDKEVGFSFTNSFELFGEHAFFGPHGWPANEEAFEWASEFTKLAQKFLDDGILKPVPILKRDGGLAGVLDGLNELREGKVAGGKLVYSLD